MDPKPSSINNTHNYKEKEIIKWVPLFEDALSRTFRSKGHSFYIVRYNANVTDIRYDPLTANTQYGASGSTLRAMINHLHHSGIIFVMTI